MLFGRTDRGPLEDHTAALMDLWFTRATGHPLLISLICPKNHSLPEGFLATMSRYSVQWGRIELGIPMADFLVFNKIPGLFPLLGSLSIQITDSVHPFNGRYVNVISSLPNLTALHLMDQNLVPIVLEVAHTRQCRFWVTYPIFLLTLLTALRGLFEQRKSNIYTKFRICSHFLLFMCASSLEDSPSTLGRYYLSPSLISPNTVLFRPNVQVTVTPDFFFDIPKIRYNSKENLLATSVNENLKIVNIWSK
jgi:hypothetical protein